MREQTQRFRWWKARSYFPTREGDVRVRSIPPSLKPQARARARAERFLEHSVA